jgi:hypothetical protein
LERLVPYHLEEYVWTPVLSLEHGSLKRKEKLELGLLLERTGKSEKMKEPHCLKDGGMNLASGELIL